MESPTAINPISVLFKNWVLYKNKKLPNNENAKQKT